MDFWHSLGGMVAISITSADVPKAISDIHKAQIVLSQVKQTDDPFTVTFQIRRSDFRKFRKLAERQNISWRITEKSGVYWRLKGLLKRPVLLIGMAFLLTLISFLPSRIFFFRVEGNTKIPTNLILEKSQQCGLTFGASRSKVRSEKMKNALLEAIPQLQWAGINTSGCVATISVRERNEQEVVQQQSGIRSIVAARDGVIIKITATKGNALCAIGQAVQEGQVLISGYTDCGIAIRGELAEGEIFALTKRNLSVVFPSERSEYGNIQGQKKKYSLIIGKKRINFYKGSGISPGSCVKMYSEKYVTLPGGFELPIAIAVEEWTYYEQQSCSVAESVATEILSDFSGKYLSSQMIAGECISQKQSVSAEDGVYVLKGSYSCTEMIGVAQNEELVRPNG